MPPAELVPGRQGTLSRGDRKDFMYSVVFRLWSVGGLEAKFSELGALTSEIEQTEYMESGPFGRFFSRHPGRFKPPSLVLKRAARTGPSTTWLWTWHQSARVSPQLAKHDCWLDVYGPGRPGAAVATYGLLGAWISKMELSGAKAGGTEMVIQTVTLQCDELVDMALGI